MIWVLIYKEAIFDHTSPQESLSFFVFHISYWIYIMDFIILLALSCVNLISLLDIYLDISDMSNALYECLISEYHVKKFIETYFNYNGLKILSKEQLPSKKSNRKSHFILLYIRRQFQIKLFTRVLNPLINS